jgi:leader peptidase (prepilin peptidase)/N-methyltransferase
VRDDELIQALLSPWALGLLGLCVGSFLNVVIHRLPRMLERQWQAQAAEVLGQPVAEGEPLSLAAPPSRCPHCGHQIRWYENVPVISWLVLRGRCSACAAPISWRYPFIELLTGALFAAVAWRLGPEPMTLAWCAVVAALIAMAGIDWDTTYLPDDLTLPLLWAGLLVAALGWGPLSVAQSFWGVAAGYLSLWSVYQGYKLLTGKEGMGYGDFKLLAALGAWLGATMILPIVLGASVIGAVVGIGMKLTGGLREGRYVPFGPFLAGAGLLVLLAGPARVLGWMGWA